MVGSVVIDKGSMLYTFSLLETTIEEMSLEKFVQTMQSGF